MPGNLTDFGFGGGSTTSLVNIYSAGGSSSVLGIQAQGANGAKEVLSGALTADALATLLSVTGAGEVPFLTIYSKNNAARALRIQVIVDGQAVPAFDATSDVIGNANQGIPVIAVGAAPAVPSPSPIRFNRSLEVNVASSLTETNNVAIGYILNKLGG